MSKARHRPQGLAQRWCKLFAYLCLFLSLSACVQLLAPKVEPEIKKLRPGAYTLDASHASLLFKVKHLGLSTYVGRFNSFDASLEFNPEDLNQTKLDAIVDMRSVDSNNNALKNTLLGREWFHTEAYPQARFSSDSAKALDDKRFEFSGTLDWRGHQQQVVLIGQFLGGATNLLTGKYTLGFSATGTFLRSDFGMDRYSAFVGDEIAIEVEAEFQRN